MTARFFLSAALLLALSSGIPAHAGVFRELYISPDGDDANPGTKAKPFQTLSHARDAVRVVSREMSGDITVNLRGGNYPVTTPLEFTAADSGRNGFKIIYRAYKKEIPILSGGVVVTNWTSDRGGIYKATLDWNGKLRSLYVNGVRAAMTQAEFTGQGAWGKFTVTGNEPWAETAGKTLDGIRFNSAEVPPLTNPSDVELVQHRVWNFLVLCARDVSAEGSNTIVKLQQPYGAIAATMAWGCNLGPTNQFTIRNAYEFLNQPGQFYFNRTTHTLYYFARAGEDMSKAVVIAPLSEGLLRVTGNSTNDRVKNLIFTGLTFSYDHWLLQQVGDSRGMVGVQSLGLYTRFRADGNWHKSHYNICDLPQATVELRNAENIFFARNHFTHLASGCAVSLVNDVVDSDVSGNVFDDISGNAVNIGHPQHYIIGDGPLFANRLPTAESREATANEKIVAQKISSRSSPKGGEGRGEEADTLKIKNPSPQPSPRLGGERESDSRSSDAPNMVEGVCARDKISNNLIRRVSLDYKQGEAISGFFTEAVEISHNDIAGVPYGGIALGWWWGNAEIPASTVPRNNVIAFNKVFDTQEELPKDGGAIYVLGEQPGGRIEGNYVHSLSRLIYPDDGSSGWTISRNVLDPQPNGKWLFVWTDRIHHLQIENNFITGTNLQNKATNNCTPVGTTVVTKPFTGDTKKIIESAGLEKKFQNIALP